MDTRSSEFLTILQHLSSRACVTITLFLSYNCAGFYHFIVPSSRRRTFLKGDFKLFDSFYINDESLSAGLYPFEDLTCLTLTVDVEWNGIMKEERGSSSSIRATSYDDDQVS